MNLTKNKCYHGFTLIDEQKISEVRGSGRVFVHERSGAKLIHIENTDHNKVFTVTFKTPPSDDTGVAHIVEHAVCCASEKYPLKDTFVEMDKGSLNTALNACTYKDMTMYYCASQNEKDLLNLMEVYMDLIFNPLMFERTMIFRQEGWHYCLEDLEDELTYNGIVYNEMKGEYAEPTALLEYEMHRALFPQSPYRFDSGGIPEAITTLSQESFEAFYRKYYTPHNATIYLYGDGDLMKQLELLDEHYLSKMSANEKIKEIPLQQCLKKPKQIKRYYASSKGSEEEDRTILAYSFVVGEVIDVKLRLAFQILEHMLLKSAASPLAEALVTKLQLGKVLEEAGYDPGKRQPTFSFVLSGAKKESRQQFEATLFEILKKLVDQGIDQELLEASIHTVTFGLYEGESQSEPKGVLYSEDVQMSMLYGGEPFAHLSYEKELACLSADAKQGYFEKLIEKYFLNNTHRVLLQLEPKENLTQNKEKAIRKQLKAYKKTLKKTQLKQLIALNEQLDAFQEEANTAEDLERLPTLGKQDLRREVEPIKLRKESIKGVHTVWQEEDTNGIIYLHLLFDTRTVKEEDIPYIGILANVLTYIGTKNYSYSALENAINSHTGGINCSINAYGDAIDTDQYQPLFKISSKVLGNDIEKTMQLLEEIVTQTVFEDEEKLKEILSYVAYEMERSFTGAPEYRASRRLYTYFSKAAVYEDQVSGLLYYEYISKMSKAFEDHFEVLVEKLQLVYAQIMVAQNLKMYITCDEKSQSDCHKQLQTFVKKLPMQKWPHYHYALEDEVRNEGFMTANEVQAIAKGYNFRKAGFAYNGALHVVTHLVNSTYLWDKVRLQGGAYGCEIALSRDGNLVACSYCDPNLEETLNVFDGIGAYLQTLILDEKELLKYTIGTIGAIDYPMTIEQKSERAIVYDLCQLNEELLQKERDQILDITLEGMKAFIPLFEALAHQKCVCVIGNEEALMQKADLFDQLTTI